MSAARAMAVRVRLNEAIVLEEDIPADLVELSTSLQLRSPIRALFGPSASRWHVEMLC